MRSLPELPARNFGSAPRIFGPQIIFLFARDVLHDRIRFRQREIAVDENRRSARWVEGEKLRRVRQPFRDIYELELERNVEMSGNRLYFAGVRRRRESIKFQADLLCRMARTGSGISASRENSPA